MALPARSWRAPAPTGGGADAPPPGWLDRFSAKQRVEKDEGWILQNQALHDGYDGIYQSLIARGHKPEEFDTTQLSSAYTMASPQKFRDPAKVWAAAMLEHQADPKQFADLPGDQQEFERQILARHGARQRDQALLSRPTDILGLTADIAGGLIGNLQDPGNLVLNVGGGALTGGGGGIATTVLNEAIVNGILAGVAEPLTVEARNRLGEKTDPAAIASDIGMGALTGGILGGTGKVISKYVAPQVMRVIGKSYAGMSDAIKARLPKGVDTPIEDIPADILPDVAEHIVGTDGMSDDAKAAAAILRRDADIEAANPYVPDGKGTQSYRDELDATIRAMIEAPEKPPIAPPDRGTSGDVSRGTGSALGAIEQYKAMVRAAESSGNDAARAVGSSAVGRYQFTRDTWLRYYKRRFGDQGLSDDAIAAKRTDGALQEQLMADLTSDNAHALVAAGHPVTPGNLYLMHFAGEGGAKRILGAADRTPIEQILSAEAIAANPFLRGKTAGDVRAWADAKMGGGGAIDGAAAGDVSRGDEQALALIDRPDAPAPSDILSDPGNGSADAGGASALRPGDLPDPVTLPILRPVDPPTPRELNDALTGYVRYTGGSLDPTRLSERTGATRAQVLDALKEIARNEDLTITPRGSFTRNPVKRPDDLLSFLAKAGGIQDSEWHALVKGRNLGTFAPAGGVLIRKSGRTLDQARELAAEAGYFHGLYPNNEEAIAKTTTADLLNLIEQSSSDPVYSHADLGELERWQTWKAGSEAFADAEGTIAAQALDYGIELNPSQHLAAALDLMHNEVNASDAVMNVINRRLADVMEAAAAQIEDIQYDIHAKSFLDRLESGEIVDPGQPFADFARSAPESGFAGGGDGSSEAARPAGGGAGGGQAVDYQADPDTGSIEFAGAAVKPWDDPAGAAFADQLQNMEHDLRAALDHGAAVDPAIAERQRQQLALKAGSANAAKVDQEGTIGLGLFDAADQFGFQLDEHGAPVNLRDVLNEIDAEDAAIQAAKDCL